MSYPERLNEISTLNTFKPGAEIWHPEKRYGRVVEAQGTITISYLGANGHQLFTRDPDGWEALFMPGPGYLAIRADDLDLEFVETRNANEKNPDGTYFWSDVERAGIRLAKAKKGIAPPEGDKK